MTVHQSIPPALPQKSRRRIILASCVGLAGVIVVLGAVVLLFVWELIDPPPSDKDIRTLWVAHKAQFAQVAKLYLAGAYAHDIDIVGGELVVRESRERPEPGELPTGELRDNILALAESCGVHEISMNPARQWCQFTLYASANFAAGDIKGIDYRGLPWDQPHRILDSTDQYHEEGVAYAKLEESWFIYYSRWD